jgi:tetratricopeptide (TPR) repeat protein
VNPNPNATQSSVLSPQSSDEPGELAAVGALLLVAALVASIFWAMNDPAVQNRYVARGAQALLADGRYSEAAALYERTLPTYNTPAVRLGLSYAYLARRDGDRAERQAREALSSAPPDLGPAAWTQLGRVLASQGRTQEALDAWSAAVESAALYPAVEPIQAEARSAAWHTAVSKWARGDYPSTRAGLQRLQGGNDIYALSAQTELAQLLAPTDRDISQKLLAGLEARVRDLENSRQAKGTTPGAPIPDLGVPGLGEGLSMDVITGTIAGLRQAYLDVDRARRSGVDDAGIAALWGRTYLQLAQPYLAKTYLQRAVQLQPQLADAHAYLALALIDTGDAASALDHLDKAVALSPQRPLAHHALAQLYTRRQDWPQAARELATLKKLEPDGVQTHIQMADYYSLRGAYDLAEAEYVAAVDSQRATGNQSGGLDASLALSRFYTDLRGLGCQKGLAPAQESLKSHPGDPSSLDAVGWALVQCGKPNDAVHALESATASAPAVPRFHYHLAKAYAGLSRTADARAQYTRVMDLDPTGPWERLAKAEVAKLRT